jgi:hypothetical protein
MGRASNNFTSWVGHAAETSVGEVTLPEKDLWIAVLCRAVLDACKGPPNLNMNRRANVSHKNHWNYNQDQARHFFLKGGAHFRNICEMAGRNPQYVQDRVRKVILRKNGWNVDVPITSHYRQGPKRGSKRRKHKKKLTGNSYYAAMGKKGGRPRLYG